MRQAIFYQLYKEHHEFNEYIPVFEFMGDVWCEDLKLGGFVSHECSARLSEINRDNPGMLEIKRKKAKYSGAHYFCYRLSRMFYAKIKDDDLNKFYDKLIK